MQFTDLHNDALLALIKFLPDLSLVNFSLACRSHFQLADPIIKHRKYLTLYRCLQLADSWHHGARWTHPIEVIYSIRHDRSIVNYIEEIEYAPTLTHLSDEDEPLTEDQQAKLEECNYLEDEINNLAFLSEDDNRKWKQDAREGGKNVTFVILLSLCIHATTLSLDAIDSLPEHLNRAVGYLNDENRRHPVSQDERNASSEQMQLFPRLTTLLLSHHDTEIGMSFEKDYGVLEIPTLNKLNLQLIGYDECEEDWVWRSGRSCSARQVDTFSCAFKPEALASFIRGLPQLELMNYDDRFQFDCGIDWQSIEEFAEHFQRHAQAVLRERSLEVIIVAKWHLRIQKVSIGQPSVLDNN